jgi:hypothetical protein
MAVRQWRQQDYTYNYSIPTVQSRKELDNDGDGLGSAGLIL